MSAIPEKPVRITEVLQNYWEERAAGGLPPTDAAINPADLGPLWEHCFLVQVVGNGEYHYLHMGSAIIEAYGDDLTGREVCERLVGVLHSPLVREFAEVKERRQPVLKESSFENSKKQDIRYRAILLPLRREGDSIDYILGGMKWKAY